MIQSPFFSRKPWSVLAVLFLLSTPLRADEQTVIAFDFGAAVESDRSGNHPASFHEGKERAAPRQVEGENGPCLAFNGKQGLVVASKGLRFDERKLTLVARVRVEALPAQGGAVIASQAGRFIFGVRPGGHLYAQFLVLPERKALSSTGTDKLVPGVWHTVSASYDGTLALLSIDGKVVANQGGAGTLAGSSNPLVIGGRFLYPGDFVNGENRLIEGFEGLIASFSILRRGQEGESAD